MARPYVATAVSAFLLALLLCLQLTFRARWPLPQWSWTHLENFPTWLEHDGSRNHGATSSSASSDTPYTIGVGKADITGPVVELNLMGYADNKQVGTGLRQRIFARTFIVEDSKSEGNTIAYIVLDTQSGDTAVRHGILDGLRDLGDEFSRYGQNNVAVVGTHSHSGPGAWLNYLLPQITSKGFSHQSYQAIVDGAILSVKRAHKSLRPGHLSFGAAEVEDANINRSLYAYLANPAPERAKYPHDVDKTMTLIRFTDAASGKHMGILSWFPVHGTSMLGNNTLISGDNKGLAALQFEKEAKNMRDTADGFVAGFSQANVGDTSPNVLGAYCEDGTGEQCSFKDSTCKGRNEPCHGRGPFFRRRDQGASSCFEIGQRQYRAAKSIFDSMDSTSTSLSGPIRSLHSFHDLSHFGFTHPNGSIVHTCPAALGYSFAAGTTDGPGAFDFKQNNPGDPKTNPVWGVVRNLLKAPSAEQKACHAPKPILLDVGEMDKPYAWTPNIVDVQTLRIGQLFIIVSAGEATTMAGRRWISAVRTHVTELGLTEPQEPIVVLGGPANSYTHYIATEEEYAIQRYEGASTLYGPHTLNAHINLTTSYLHYLSKSTKAAPPSGPNPPINTNHSLSFISDVVFDAAPLFKNFGDVLKDVDVTYHPGETVTATFVGANPRNNLRLEQTYAAVELQGENGVWGIVRDDSDWNLVFRWKRTSTVLGTSEGTIEWAIEEGTQPGRYRLRYYGDRKAIGGAIQPFDGSSGGFSVT